MVEEKCSISKVLKSNGIYRFQVEGYSGLSTRVGDSIESPEFALCDYTWQLRIFPGGSLDLHKGYVSFYLASKSNKLARASYKLCVLNQIIGGEDECFSSSGVRIFEAKGVQVDGWGRDKFMPVAMLKDPTLGFRVEDVIVFKVEITVYGELEATPVLERGDSVRWISSLEGCLRNMFNDPETSDILIKSGSKLEVVHAHKCILSARSEVFKAMFFSSFCESVSSEVIIPDVEAVVMREAIFYMYTDSLPEHAFLAEHATSLLMVSLKYQLPCLLDCAETFLVSALTPECAPTVLLFAENICCPSLKKRIILFIAQNSEKVLQLKDFQELDSELLGEAKAMVDLFEKKRGYCNRSEKERKISFGCSIM